MGRIRGVFSGCTSLKRLSRYVHISRTPYSDPCRRLSTGSCASLTLRLAATAM